MNVDELIVQNAGWIRRRARKYYESTQDAEDLASETIYKCLKNAGRFDPRKGFRPWASTIMENTFKTEYNRRKCVLFTRLTSYEPGYESHMTSDQLASLGRIGTIIRECGRKSCCISCVILYAKGYTYEEISEMEGIPVGTVKSRLSAGRRMLKEALG